MKLTKTILTRLTDYKDGSAFSMSGLIEALEMARNYLQDQCEERSEQWQSTTAGQLAAAQITAIEDLWRSTAALSNDLEQMDLTSFK